MTPRGGTSRRGRLIVLEGLDGAGTTTQAHRLGERLAAAGVRVHVTAEPSRGPVGALVRQVLTRRVVGAGDGFDPGALALLFAADRVDHHAVEIAPKLAQGIDVVTDRYTLSSLAYQGLATGDMAWVEAVNARAPAADVTIFLRARPEVAFRRRRAASLDREIFEVSSFQRRVARSYDEAVARLRAAGQEVVEVDGEAPVPAVGRAVWAVVQRMGRAQAQPEEARPERARDRGAQLLRAPRHDVARGPLAEGEGDRGSPRLDERRGSRMRLPRSEGGPGGARGPLAEGGGDRGSPRRRRRAP